MAKMTILAATDFSKNADYALSRAASLAQEKNAKLVILHVVQKKWTDKFLDTTLKSLLPKTFYLKTEQYKETLIQEKIQELSQQLVDIEYVLITKGKPANKILQYAKKHKVDLLVLGAHGSYSIRDTFVGTTAEYIVKKTTCPVLIVKTPCRNNYSKIVAPVDFSKVSQKALNYGLQCFPTSQFNLIHVGDYEYANILKRVEMEIPKNKIAKIQKAILLSLDMKMKAFIKGLKRANKKISFSIIFGYPGLSIVKEAVKIGSDLIVMGTQGHGREHYQLIGSVANWVVTNTKKDILLVP